MNNLSEDGLSLPSCIYSERDYIEGDPAHSFFLFHLYLFNIPSYKLILIPQIL